MTSIPGLQGAGVFALVPMTVNVSRFLDDNAVTVWIYLRSRFAHEDGFTDAIKADDIASVLGMSRSTFDRAKRRLEKYGFAEVEGAGTHGLKFKVNERANVPDDFGKFGKDPRYGHTLTTERFAKVTRDMVTHGPGARAIRIFVIFDRIAGRDRKKPENYGWAYVSHTDLGKWLGVDPETISDDIGELKNHGLAEVEDRGPGRGYRYRVNTHLKNPHAKYVPTLKVRKQQAAKEAKKQAAAAAREARKNAEAAERLRSSLENRSDDEPSEWDVARDLSVYWFKSLGDVEWAIRYPNRVFTLQTTLRVMLLEIRPESVKTIIDNHLHAHGDTTKPLDLVGVIRKHFTPAGDDYFKRLLKRNHELYQAARAGLDPEPDEPDEWLVYMADASAYRPDVLADPGPVSDVDQLLTKTAEEVRQDTANRHDTRAAWHDQRHAALPGRAVLGCRVP